MAKSWVWISGWAIHPDRFRSAVISALPNDSHKILAPTPDALKQVLAGSENHIGGYSLGSLILLSALKQIPKVKKMVCLAPFIAFCKEKSMGGTTPEKTLKALQKRLHAQPKKALQLFYRLAGLDYPPENRLPYPIEHLQWGLAQLATLQADPSFPQRAEGIADLNDPLINSQTMRSEWPNCYFAEECGHDYYKLLGALSGMNFDSKG